MRSSNSGGRATTMVFSIVCDAIEVHVSGRYEPKVLENADVSIEKNEIYIDQSKYKIKGKDIQRIHLITTEPTTTVTSGSSSRSSNISNTNNNINHHHPSHHDEILVLETTKNTTFRFIMSNNVSIGSSDNNYAAITSAKTKKQQQWEIFVHRIQTMYNKYHSQEVQGFTNFIQSSNKHRLGAATSNAAATTTKQYMQQPQGRSQKRGVFGSQKVVLPIVPLSDRTNWVVSQHQQQQQQQESAVQNISTTMMDGSSSSTTKTSSTFKDKKKRKMLLQDAYENFSSDDDNDNDNDVEAMEVHEDMNDDNDDENDENEMVVGKENVNVEQKRNSKPKLKKLVRMSQKKIGFHKNSNNNDNDDQSDDDDIFNNPNDNTVTTPAITTQRLVSPHTTTTTTSSKTMLSSSISPTSSGGGNDYDIDVVSRNNQVDDSIINDKMVEEEEEEDVVIVTDKSKKQQSKNIHSFFQPRSSNTNKSSLLSTNHSVNRLIPPSTPSRTKTPPRHTILRPVASTTKTTHKNIHHSRSIITSKSHHQHDNNDEEDDDAKWLIQSPVRKLQSPQEKRRYELFGTTTSTTTQESTTSSPAVEVLSTNRRYNNNNNTKRDSFQNVVLQDDPIEDCNSPPRKMQSLLNSRSLLNTSNKPSLVGLPSSNNNISSSNSNYNSAYRPLNFAKITNRRRIAPTALVNPFANSSSTPVGLMDNINNNISSSLEYNTEVDSTTTEDRGSAISTYTTPKPVGYRKFRGLRNLGNTCYQNSSLQMLYSCRSLMKALYDRNNNIVGSSSSSSSSSSNSSTIGPITNSLCTIGQELAKFYLPPVNSRLIKDAMDTKTDKYVGYEQRDAHEFVSDLIDYVHEELESISNEESKTTDMDSKSVIPTYYIPTNDFCMAVQVELKCCSCGYTRNKKEMYRHLSIDIVTVEKAVQEESLSQEIVETVQIATVERSLMHFFQPEIREIKCEKCLDGSHAEQSLLILSRPKILLLHLKRFIITEKKIYPSITEIDIENHPNNIDLSTPSSGTQRSAEVPPYQIEYIFKKNKAPIEIPESLSLEPYQNLDTGDIQPSSDSLVIESPMSVYKLQSIVHHIGSRASSGHYTADAIREAPPIDILSDKTINLVDVETSDTTKSSDVWVSYDDGVTNETSMNNILTNRSKQSTAYMLLYTCE